MDAEEFSASLQKAYQQALQEAERDAAAAIEAIMQCLQVPMDFIQQIKDYLQRLTAFRNSQEPQLPGNPRLAYKEEGRSGTITFINDQTKFDMWWEFAGDDALVILSIPDVQSWEIRTGLPLQDREAILNFIGRQVVKEKITSAGAYYIGDSIITFYGPF